MFPYIDLFGLSIPVYGLISVIGVIVAGVVSASFAKGRGVEVYALIYTGMVAAFGLFLGAHLLYGITRIEDIIYIFRHYEYYDSFWEFAGNVLECFGGMVFYGGLYGGLLAGLVFAKIKKYPKDELCDVVALFIPLFHAFGRVGCFFAGCCFGVESEFGFSGRVYATGMRENITRLPVQLLEALCLVLLFGFVAVLFSRKKARGKLIFVYLLAYAVLRFVLEFLRGDEIRGSLLWLSTSQWISLVTFVWVIVYLIIKCNRKIKE